VLGVKTRLFVATTVPGVGGGGGGGGFPGPVVPYPPPLQAAIVLRSAAIRKDLCVILADLTELQMQIRAVSGGRGNAAAPRGFSL
jgi:hypothetical protein